jgi:archaellum component FlaF (FlaF/FlaG flagellin family)
MGLSVSAASAILFSSFVILFGAMFGSINMYQDKIQTAQEDNYNRALEAQATDIGIISVDAVNGTIAVMNLGTTTINPSGLDLLINGTIRTSSISSLTVEGHPGSSLWMAGEVLSVHSDFNMVGAHIELVTDCGAVAFGQ